MKNKKIVALVTILIILLVLSLGYIAYGKIAEAKQKSQINLLQQGASFGYKQAVTQLLQQASTCKTVPITMDNTTLNMVAVECLQLLQQQATSNQAQNQATNVNAGTSTVNTE